MQAFWDNYVEVSLGVGGQHLPKFRQFEFNYRKYFPKNLSEKVLDVGIGKGEMLACMKAWGYENYLGVDISPSTVSFCQNNNLNCELAADTIEWLKMHVGEFSVITLLDVIEHIQKEEVINFLRALMGALKDGGVLIIQTPNMDSPESYLHRFHDFTHLLGFTENSLRQALLTSGFLEKNLSFFGFEILVKKNLLHFTVKIARFFYWDLIKIFRLLNTNLNPKILNPVLCAVVGKG